MACEICGKTVCTRCFHSLEEQEEFDTKTGRFDLGHIRPLKMENVQQAQRCEA